MGAFFTAVFVSLFHRLFRIVNDIELYFSCMLPIKAGTGKKQPCFYKNRGAKNNIQDSSTLILENKN